MKRAMSICLTALFLAIPAAAGQAMEACEWRVTDDSTVDRGLRALDGADGATTFVVRDGVRCLANKPDAARPSAYLYFDIDDAGIARAGQPVYVVVEYFDGALGGSMILEYDSDTGDSLRAKYRTSERQWGGWFTGKKVWRTAVFALERPSWRNRQNLGADFRLTGAPLFVRAARVTSTRPEECERLEHMEEVSYEELVSIGPGGQFIIGGFDSARAEDVPRQIHALEQAAPGLKAIGVTSHEGYVRWNLCEPEQGRYDWSVYDAYVDLYRKYDLKWVPFLIVGSAYSLPDWYYKKPGSQGYVCLEHGEESDVESLWNPALRGHVARFIEAFCEHYRDGGVIESILLGITGNYGEAIYVATGNDWTADIHGQYHTHYGLWAGDPHAIASFRAWLANKYGNVDALNEAWGTSHAGLDAVRPFLRADAPGDRAWLDFCDWYIGSMNEWARFWMSETRKHFPSGDINLCTGGHAPPEHGADFGEQCKIAAEVGGGVRITNEASDYRQNFSLTRWVASAGSQYGAYFSFEPAGQVNAEGVIARIYNATASGARGLHYYYPNLFGAEESSSNFVEWGAEFRQRTPITEIGVYYPQTSIKLHGNDFLGRVQPLRDRFDFCYLSDGQILDGGLQSVKALVLLAGNTSEAPVWHAITEWVRSGGLLLYAEGMGRLRTVEGDEAVHDVLFASGADVGEGRIERFDGPNDGDAYRAFLSERLAAAAELSSAGRRMVELDGEEDGLFVTVCSSSSLLWLNYTPDEAQKGGLTLPPYSIVTQEL